MLVNADFSRRASLTPDQYQWVPSPQPGVERVMLDRLGAEYGHATSLVRYAPGVHFPLHQHPGGEEVLVLSGTWCEGAQQYPAGTYLRNPPGSSHAPFSSEGATLFVKLWQMAPEPGQPLRIDTRDPAAWSLDNAHECCELYRDAVEHVWLQRLDAGSRVLPALVPGAELLVLEGALREGEMLYPSGSWLRLPAGEYAGLVAADTLVTLYLKTGPLGARSGQGEHR